MAWKVTDYNLNTIHTKSEESINTEYERLRGIVGKRVETYEKHGMGNLSHVKVAKTATMDNNSRRMKERAIMEMRRFLNSKYSSFEKYNKSVSEGLAYWRNYGIKGLNRSNLSQFYDFLSWVKSFMGDKYRPEAVATAWTKSNGNVESAQELFVNMIDDGL